MCFFYDGTTLYTIFCGELKSYVNRALFLIKIVQRMDLIVVVKSGGMLEVCRVLLGAPELHNPPLPPPSLT